MICGPGRAGKSSLIDSLKNKPISKKKDSTPGVSLSKVTCHITHKDGKSHWPEETDTKTHQQLFLAESLSCALDSHSHAPASSELGQPDENHDNCTSKDHTSSQHGPKEVPQSTINQSLGAAIGGTKHDQGAETHHAHKSSQSVCAATRLSPKNSTKTSCPSQQKERSTFSTSGISPVNKRTLSCTTCFSAAEGVSTSSLLMAQSPWTRLPHQRRLAWTALSMQWSIYEVNKPTARW